MNSIERNVENIVAIDLGKFNSAVCIFKKSTFKSNFRTIKTNGQDFHDLFVELEPDKFQFIFLNPNDPTYKAPTE